MLDSSVGGRDSSVGVASKHLTMSCQIEEKQERELLQVKCTMFRRDPYLPPQSTPVNQLSIGPGPNSSSKSKSPKARVTPAPCALSPSSGSASCSSAGAS